MKATKPSPIRKLRIAKETLGRLEGSRLREAAGGDTAPPTQCTCLTLVEGQCNCESQICFTAYFTNCIDCVG